MPEQTELKKELLKDAHYSSYSIHPGGNKMYQDLKKLYWWNNMKKEIGEYVSKCYTCQLINIEHRKPAGELKPLPIPEWKWEHITMDFVSALPRTRERYDSIWVIVDRLTKVAHFIPIKTGYTLEQLAKLYVKEIVRLHGVPVSIVSDRDTRFVGRFWKSLHNALGTKLYFSTAYHPQTDGQSERTIQTLEDMLRACALDLEDSWDKDLPMVEFAYNNSFHASIGMPPYEALYGRKCRSPIHWDEVGDRQMLGPEMVQDAVDKVKMIRQRLQAAQSRQKSYADKRRRPLEFQVGEHVLLKISPTKGVVRFGLRGKLNPRYVGPFQILEKIGDVAYRLALPPSLDGVHNVFHVSMLRKYVTDPDEVIALEPLEVRPNLTSVERPVRIVDMKEQNLRRRVIRYVKV